jgi:hypothetical protein
MTQDTIKQLKQWDIEIKFFDQGCLVKVGCKSFAFESIEEAMAGLVAYTKDPIGVGKKYAPMEFIEFTSATSARFNDEQGTNHVIRLSNCARYCLFRR